MFDLLTRVLESSGYAGIALLMFLENVFPPIPSELIMPLAGYVAARGELSLVGVIIAGTLGSVAGTSLWYIAGQQLGRARLERLVSRHGRWFTTDVDGLHKAEALFERHGQLAVLLGRMLPTVRTLISIPAGLLAMPLMRFLVLTTVGSLVWTAALTVAGHALGDNHRTVSDWVNPVSTTIVIALLAWYVWRVFTYSRSHA